jgi:hypothetical protein
MADENDTLQKCPNYIFCDDIVPKYVLYANRGFCMNCGIRNWTRGETDSVSYLGEIECTVCFTVTNCASFSSKCLHPICKGC